MATTVRPANEDDLIERSRQGGRFELVDGEIREVSPAGFSHGEISVRLAALLLEHVRRDGLGRVVDSSTGFRLPSGNVRAPDVAFVAASRIDAAGVPRGFFPGAPDLAVEVLSPSDRVRELLDKVGEWLQSGARLVWVVDPEARTVTVHRAISDVRTLRDGELVEGEDVVPGFRCTLSDFM